MTEQEHDKEFLAELLETSGQPGAALPDEPVLTRRDEQRLLEEANSTTPPTLAPADLSQDHRIPTYSSPKRAGPVTSFGAEALDVVRRHPIPTLLMAAGLAYLLARRRNR